MHKIIFTFILSLVVVACSNDGLLSERPKSSQNNYVFEKSKSSIALGVDVPYQIIKSSAESSIDKFKVVKIDGSVDCSFKKHIDPPKVFGQPIGGGVGVSVPCSAEYKGEMRIDRVGPVAVVQGPNNTLQVTSTLSFKGHVGFRGDGAKLVGLNKKNVDGTITVTGNVNIGLKENWAPTATVDISHRWNKSPRVEAINGVFITFQDKADESIDDELKKLPEAISAAFSQVNLKAEVEQGWKIYSFVVPNTPADEKVTLQFVPENAYFSGITMTQDRAKFGVGIEGLAAVNIGAEVPSNIGALPNIKKTKLEPEFILQIPILADYTALTNIINSLLGEGNFETDTEVGKVVLSVINVETFPSDDRVAIGVKFIADVEGEMFDVKGEVYLLGKPILENDGKYLRLENIEFYRSLDNKLWSGVSFALRKFIVEEIENNAKYDLTADIDKAYTEIDKQITELQTGSDINVKLSNKSLKLAKISIDPRYLVVEGVFQGNLLVLPVQK